MTVAKPYYENEGELFDSRSFFQDDESVIQDEADFQYMNEANENTNLEFADEMSDCEAHMENYGEIQRTVGDPEFTCEKGEYLSSVTLIKQTGRLLHDCTEVSTLKCVHFKMIIYINFSYFSLAFQYKLVIFTCSFR